MTIKLIAIDIDGTLLTDTHQLTPETIAALKEKAAAGVKIVLCSGRPLIGMLPFVAELGLMAPDEYTISSNGAFVQHNADSEVLINHTLSFDEYRQFEALSQELGIQHHVLNQQNMYTPNRQLSRYTVYDSYATGMPLNYCPVDEMDPAMRFSKIMYCAEPEVLSQVIDQIPAHYFADFHLVKSMPFYFEILHKQASKGQAVRELAEKLGIEASEVMAIGDNENDVDMLTYAGLAVAMGNATPNVKAVADQITKSNNEHGVAHAVRTWA